MPQYVYGVTAQDNVMCWTNKNLFILPISIINASNLFTWHISMKRSSVFTSTISTMCISTTNIRVDWFLQVDHFFSLSLYACGSFKCWLELHTPPTPHKKATNDQSNSKTYLRLELLFSCYTICPDKKHCWLDWPRLNSTVARTAGFSRPSPSLTS